jgi:hypothetical protein
MLGWLIRLLFGGSPPTAPRPRSSNEPTAEVAAHARVLSQAGDSSASFSQPSHQLGTSTAAISEPASEAAAAPVRSAAAYCRDGLIVVHPWGYLADDSSIFLEPVISLSAETDPGEIGRAMRRALESSRRGVSLPEDWEAHIEPLYSAAGVGDWTGLQEETLACTISRENGHLDILPSRNGGVRGDTRGFHPLPERRLQLPAHCSDSELGEGLLAAFEKCE